MRKRMLIIITLAATAIAGGLLAAVADKPKYVKQSNTPVMDPTKLTLDIRDLPTVQVQEPF